MLRQMIGAMVGRRIVGSVARKHGDMAGMALGAALASRKTRGLGIAGLAALTAWSMYQDRKAATRPLKP